MTHDTFMENMDTSADSTSTPNDAKRIPPAMSIPEVTPLLENAKTTQDNATSSLEMMSNPDATQTSDGTEPIHDNVTPSPEATQGISEANSTLAIEQTASNDVNSDVSIVVYQRTDETPNSISASHASSSDAGTDVYIEVYRRTLDNITNLEKTLDQFKSIPDFLQGVHLKCLRMETLTHLKYHLDAHMDTLVEDGTRVLCKDYRGVAEWAGLEPLFIKFLSQVHRENKFSEVVSLWMKDEWNGPKPTVGNLIKCLGDIDRLDVRDAMVVPISRDALAWTRAEVEANTSQKPREDTSWQLTRHDVITGKETRYTACLMFADEDYGMAELIIGLYQKVYRDSLFFLPQYDLKIGRYEKTTTAEVIETRCEKKVLFLLSRYFFASDICQFAVNYSAACGTGNGNLIPFLLTNDNEHVPRVLKGIAGIRWFRKIARRYSWSTLTDALLDGKVTPEKLVEIKEQTEKLIKDESTYLSDPPYDDDVEPAGEPIVIVEPEGATGPPTDTTSCSPSSETSEFTASSTQSKKHRSHLLKAVRKLIEKKVMPKFQFGKLKASLRSDCKTSTTSSGLATHGQSRSTFHDINTDGATSQGAECSTLLLHERDSPGDTSASAGNYTNGQEFELLDMSTKEKQAMVAECNGDIRGELRPANIDSSCHDSGIDNGQTRLHTNESQSENKFSQCFTMSEGLSSETQQKMRSPTDETEQNVRPEMDSMFQNNADTAVKEPFRGVSSSISEPMAMVLVDGVKAETKDWVMVQKTTTETVQDEGGAKKMDEGVNEKLDDDELNTSVEDNTEIDKLLQEPSDGSSTC